MAVALQYLAVDREALAGLDQDAVAQRQGVDADALLAAVDEARRVVRAQSPDFDARARTWDEEG